MRKYVSGLVLLILVIAVLISGCTSTSASNDDATYISSSQGVVSDLKPILESLSTAAYAQDYDSLKVYGARLYAKSKVGSEKISPLSVSPKYMDSQIAELAALREMNAAGSSLIQAVELHEKGDSAGAGSAYSAANQHITLGNKYFQTATAALPKT